MEDNYCKIFVQSSALGFAIGGLLVAYIFATGQTFGQRCAKMHPNGDAATIERCVHKLKYQH